MIKKVVIMAVSVLCVSQTLVEGGVDVWNVASGNWGTHANWVDESAPTFDESAVIQNGGTAQVTTVGPGCRYLQIGDATGTEGTLEISGGSLRTVYAVLLGIAGGTGTVIQTGGDVIVDYNNMSTRTDTSIDIGRRFYLADSAAGTGLWEISGGSITSDRMSVGSDSGDTGGYVGDGIFRVVGSAATAITVINDGQYHNQDNGILDVRIDSGGLTPITATSAYLSGYLYPYPLSGATAGTYTVMTYSSLPEGDNITMDGPYRKKFEKTATATELTVSYYPDRMPLAAVTADFEQLPASQTIDLIGGNNGWAIAPQEGSNHYIIWSNAAPFTSKGVLAVDLIHEYESGETKFVLGKFKLSVTTDATPSAGGSWTELTAPRVSSDAVGMTFTVENGSEVFVGGTLEQVVTYHVEYTTDVQNITGLRLDALADTRLPYDGPGYGAGNFVLTEVTAETRPLQGTIVTLR